MKFSILIPAFFFAHASARQPCIDEDYPVQVKSIHNDWKEAEPLITIGQTCNGYTPPSIPDGMGAYHFGNTACLLVNHELGMGSGYPYGK